LRRLLIVEDELIWADIVADFLGKNDYEIVGIARTVEQAVALARLHKPELALLDMMLAHDGLGTDAAVQMSAFGRVGILYASANIELVMRVATIGDACIAKPYRFPDLLRSLEAVAEIVATGAASPPFALGFRKLPPPEAAQLLASHG
jgi:DNA-binding response OmpR family regulator